MRFYQEQCIVLFFLSEQHNTPFTGIILVFDSLQHVPDMHKPFAGR